MFSFLHAADLHLDTPFTTIRSVPDAVAQALREASLRAWDRLVDTAVEREVAFVLLAGDIYDGAERGVRAQLRFRDGLERLDAAGIRTFLVHGNHDPVKEGWVAIDRLPPLAHRFAGADDCGSGVESVTFEVDGRPVTVHGVSFAERETTENLALRFPAHPGPGFHVGLLHANIGGIEGHDPYSPGTVADLRSRGIHYWALGHIHTRTVVHRATPWVVYPGNLQGRSVRASEGGPKGAVLVEVEGGRAAEPQFVPLDEVRFVQVAAHVDQVPDTETLIERLVAAAHPELHDGRSLVVRAEVSGTGPLHHELLAPERRAEVLEALRCLGEGAPFTWWDRIEWTTRAELDLDELRQGNDFLADLVSTAEEPTGDSQVPAWAGGLPRLPAEVLRHLPEPPRPDDPATAQQALRLALDQLARSRR
jgi:DNA repair protein SbcD/Mre11